MKTFLIAATLSAAFLPMSFAHESRDAHAVPGQSLDSGLGELPHYRYWADRTAKGVVVGQKIDSGLGELPHYRYWADATGKQPVAAASTGEPTQLATLK